MDSTAVSLCMDNNLPILVLNLWDMDALRQAIMGEDIGTWWQVSLIPLESDRG